jgi:hypothetical protein
LLASLELQYGLLALLSFQRIKQNPYAYYRPTVRRGKTVTKPFALSRLGLPLSEKQIPQVVESLGVDKNQKKL